MKMKYDLNEYNYLSDVSNITLKILQRSELTGELFEDTLSWILFHRDDLYQELIYCADKYKRSVDDIIDIMLIIYKW